ncbi:hypothetical protein [Frankia sp. CeD]|uniref:hypothetical protein n=1 Tax=Frankia sp. CeD TaxID=258230 RepID=UPI00126A20DE|nr:hypothetical protein [Frankia sp. CeD]
MSGSGEIDQEAIIFSDRFDERADQVLALIPANLKNLHSISSTRCPKDGRVLASVFHLPDGMWLWTKGFRFSPEQSRVEAEAIYLDCVVDEHPTSEDYAGAAEYAQEFLEGRKNLTFNPRVASIYLDLPGDRVIVREIFNRPHGIPITESVSCSCRTQYLLDAYELIRLAVRWNLGAEIRKTPILVPPMPMPRIGVW